MYYKIERFHGSIFGLLFNQASNIGKRPHAEIPARRSSKQVKFPATSTAAPFNSEEQQPITAHRSKIDSAPGILKWLLACQDIFLLS